VTSCLFFFLQVILVQVNPGETFTIRTEDGALQCIQGLSNEDLFSSSFLLLFKSVNESRCINSSFWLNRAAIQTSTPNLEICFLFLLVIFLIKIVILKCM